MRRRHALIALAGAAATVAAASPVLAKSAPVAPKFNRPVLLEGFGGGEPSLALDPKNPRNVYVTAPQGIPTGLNLAFGGAATSGVGFWASHDGGKTFPIAKDIGSSFGGGDSDVEVGSDGTVYIADLEAAGAAICTSHDQGKTFTSGNGAASVDGCKNVTTNQQGPDNDRQWLNVGRGQKDTVYLTYHDFAAGFPIMERSDDGGASFSPCGTILDPSGAAAQQYAETAGTLVAKPTLDQAGRMYVEVTEPSGAAPGASLNTLYIAVADHGCASGTVFKNYKVYSDPGADLGKIFNSVTVDKAGNVYVIAAGKTKANQSTTNVWMFVSRDHGAHWSAPLRVNSTSLKANVMPAVVGGLKGNEVAVGWFGTSNSGDPNFAQNQWRYYVATSFDGGKHFNQTTITSSPIHYGDICTQGLFCDINSLAGNPGSNRNLADFDSIAVDPRTGELVVAFPGDPNNRPDLPNGPNNFTSSAYVVHQVGGRPLK